MTGCGINLRPPEGVGSASGLPTTPKAQQAASHSPLLLTPPTTTTDRDP